MDPLEIISFLFWYFDNFDAQNTSKLCYAPRTMNFGATVQKLKPRKPYNGTFDLFSKMKHVNWAAQSDPELIYDINFFPA